MKMKKFILLFIAMASVLSFSACTQQASSASPISTPSAVAPETTAAPTAVPTPADTPSPTPVPTADPLANVPQPSVTQRDIPVNDAMQFAADMMNGWNLGNTFDAFDDSKSEAANTETMWVGVKTSRAMIDAVRDAGFRSIRIPVTWHVHVDADYNIDPTWLDRVQEVVGWAIDDGLIVILNTHHDESTKFIFPDSAHYDSSSKYLTAVWSQIAARFKDYDNHLVFEGMNEPRLVGTSTEWWQDMSQAVNQDTLATVCKLNQDFVDTVRASGGNNADRYLMIPGIGANADTVMSKYFTMPTDTADNKIMISVHAYTPYNFALEPATDSASVSTFDMTSAKSTGDIDSFMDKLYTTFISKGIPVVIGEFGAMKKGDNEDSRVQFTAYYAASANARGIPCLWWDNYGMTGSGELFGILERKTATWAYPDIVAALTEY